MDTQNKKCADPILEKLGLGHFYYGDKPLVWMTDFQNPNELHEDVASYNAEECDLSRYFVKEGEFGTWTIRKSPIRQDFQENVFSRY